MFLQWCPEVLPRWALCVELEEEVPFAGEVGQHSLIPAISRSPSSSTTTEADAQQQQQYWSCFSGVQRLFLTPHQGSRFPSGSSTAVVIEFLWGALMVDETPHHGGLGSSERSGLNKMSKTVWLADFCNHFLDLSWNKPVCNQQQANDDWGKPRGSAD